MDSHSNYSSSSSDSGNQEETACSISPSKSHPETVALNITRSSKEKVVRKTSNSSTNSESMINFPGKRAPAIETQNIQELDQGDGEGPVESKRITRSSRRGEGVCPTEPTQNLTNKGAKTNKSKKISRKSNRKLRNKIPIHQPELRESEYSSEGEDTPPLPPLVLMVSIPIENSSVNGEDSPAQSDAGSEISELPETSNMVLHHNKGKDIGNLDEEYSSKDSLDNGSSSERSNSIVSSQEDSGGEGGSKVPQSSEVTSGDQEDVWKQQTSSRSGDESLESSNEEPAVSHLALVGKRRADSSKATDNSGKSIPNRRRRAGNNEGSPDPTLTVKATNKRALKRSKVGSSKEEEIKKRIKHVIQLDQEMDPTQLEAILLESYHILRNRDQQAIFCSPVTDDIAPGYSKLITQPMDFSRMKQKIDTEGYARLEQLFDDFLLMCQNAMSYNKPTTYYYRAAKRIKETGIKNLEKLARSYVLSREKSNSSLQEETHMPISKPKSLIVSIDRSSLSVPSNPSKRRSLISPNKITQENESHTHSQTVSAIDSLANSECTESKIESKLESTVTSLETDLRQKQSGMDTDTVNADTSLLPPPSSYNRSHSQAFTRLQPSPIDRVTNSNNTGTNTRDMSSTKKQPTLMEVKQRKFNKKREQSFQRMYTRASQARRIYGGSLAPVRPLSYGSFASFAPNYDSSFANINCQETDRVYSIVEQRELRECEDSMLYTSCDNEVSPYYLRLADGILSLDRDKSSRTERNSALSQDMIRMNILRQQAYQGEMRRRMECSYEAGLGGRIQQQLDEMLQQSAELISCLSKKQGREEHEEQGVGEELNMINKILLRIGAAIKNNESS